MCFNPRTWPTRLLSPRSIRLQAAPQSLICPSRPRNGFQAQDSHTLDMGVCCACFSPGLPSGWTEPRVGAVKPGVLDEHLQHNLKAGNRGALTSHVAVQKLVQVQDPMPCVSLFTGVGGLELGLHPCGPQVRASVFKSFLPPCGMQGSDSPFRLQ